MGIKFLFLNVLYIFFFVYVSAQSNPVEKIDSFYYSKIIDSLEIEFGKNKIIPSDYKLQILIALSFFPELKNEVIIFRKHSIPTTMSSIPNLFSIFGNKNNRTYVITFNDKENFDGIYFEDVPFNGQIGVLGHELAHVWDYKQRNFFGIVARGLDYLCSNSKSKYEKEIDMITINHNLGWQIYDWSYFALYKSNATEKYENFKRKIYYTSEDILKILESIPKYTE